MNNEVVIFFSGMERLDTLKKIFKLLDNGMPLSGALFTYFHIEPQILRYVKKLKEEYGVRTMLDSGAFSLLRAKISIDKGTEKEDYVSKDAVRIVKSGRTEWYFKRYFRFLKKYSDLFDVYVELDLQMIVGEDKVNEWRQMFKDEGLTPVLVWHGEPIEKVHDMLEYSDHFGLPWKHPGISDEYMMSIVRYVRKHTDGWIHWFGMTSWGAIKSLAYERVINSTDSTTWLSAQRYGNVLALNENNDVISLQISPNLKKKSLKYRRPRYISRYRKFLEKHENEIRALGLDFDGIYELKKWQEISLLNLYVYNKALEYLNNDLKNGKTVKHLDLTKHTVEGDFDFSKFERHKKLTNWLAKSDGGLNKFRKDEDLRRWL